MKNELQILKYKLQDKKIRMKRAIYYLLVLGLFISVIYDSYQYSLPFYYIIYFIGGYYLGYLEKFSSKIKWDKEKKMFYEQSSSFGLVIMISLLLFRIFLVPQILDYGIHPIHLVNAVSLVSMGVFYKKVLLYRESVDDMIFNYALSLHKDTQNLQK